MSKLLTRAKTRYEASVDNYRNISADDAYFDAACYNVQQCIEFTMKYLVEIHGGQYVENHDVRAQLNKMEQLGVDFPFAEQVRSLAVTLNEWEARSRYADDFVATKKELETAIVLAKSLLDHADSLVYRQERTHSVLDANIAEAEKRFLQSRENPSQQTEQDEPEID